VIMVPREDSTEAKSQTMATTTVRLQTTRTSATELEWAATSARMRSMRLRLEGETPGASASSSRVLRVRSVRER